MLLKSFNSLQLLTSSSYHFSPDPVSPSLVSDPSPSDQSHEPPASFKTEKAQSSSFNISPFLLVPKQPSSPSTSHAAPFALDANRDSNTS